MFKSLHIFRNYTTGQWSSWWKKRKIDWKNEYIATWNHPHRQMISAILKTFKWRSLLEVGMGAGANLINIIKVFPQSQLAGIDINPTAVEEAKKIFQGALLKQGNILDIPVSDRFSDVVLTDMCLIYIDPFNISLALEELKRVARGRIVLCEFDVDNLWDRIKLFFGSGLHGHNYSKLLPKHGYYDIIRYQIPPEIWGGEHGKWGFIIIARVPPSPR